MSKEVHRLAVLGVQLIDSDYGDIIMKNRADLPLVVEVKEK